jgi:type VI secretion system secreted protein VgrG
MSTSASNLTEGLSLSPADLLALFGTGLSQQSRLIEIETAQGSGLPESLVVERFWGREGVNELFHFEVEAFSVSSALNLTPFIGEQITLRILLPEGGHRSWHGYCTSAAWLGADGGLARYRLSLSPFLAFLGLRRDAYIFQDKDTLAIVHELLADYPQANVRMEVTQTLKPRPICTQYGESDLDFCTRLLASEGLSWRFEHEQNAISDSNASATSTGTTGDKPSSPHAKHCLVIFDAASSLSQWPSVAPDTIRYHRADATEAQDSITSFSAQRQIGANSVALSAWEPEQLLAPSAELTSSLERGAQPTLGMYDGAGLGRYPDSAYAQHIAQLRLAALELPGKTFSGSGTARQMSAGTRFNLSQHEHYPETGDANQFKLLWVEHGAANNLSAQVSDLLARLSLHAKSASSPGSARANSYPNNSNLSQLERGSYRNQFCAVRAAVPVVPKACAQSAPHSAPGPQTAQVVGLSGETLTTERNHRVKVQFAWQRGSQPNAGGLTDTGTTTTTTTGAPSSANTAGNAPGNETSGTWVRISEALAGPNWGTQFTPRIGTEVLIDYLDADLDQPVIVAQLYNGADTPPFAAGVDSAANHGGTLSGWHSHNLSGSESSSASAGYNQWVLDDSTAQLRMRLGSSSAASQLNTGYLISQSPNSAQRGSYRGSGFELRTDAWGVIRAPQGLLLSSTARAQNGSSVTSSQMDTQETQAQLKAAQNLTNALHQAAKQQQALGAEQVNATAQAQQSLLQSLDPQQQGSFKQQGATSLNGQSTQKAQSSSRELNTAPEAAVERFGAALIVAEAPSAIVLTSPASSALFAAEQLQLVSQGDSHLGAAHTVAMVAGKTQTFFTHAGGLEAVAANGPLSLQAHTDQLELLADKEVTVVSVNDSISINAKNQIVLKAGQSSITLDGANITFACPGTFSVKGSGHSLGGGASAAASLPVLPTGVASVSTSITPLETVYSQALNFTEVPSEWLPFTLGMSTVVRADAEQIATLDRSPNNSYSSGVVTKQVVDVSYWISTDTSWRVEEDIEQTLDIAVVDSIPEDQDE